MYHNDEVMTNWKDSVMTAEGFEAKEDKKANATTGEYTAIEEGVLNCSDKVLDEMAAITESGYVSARDEEPIVVKEGGRAKNRVLLYKIEKKLAKMGFTYDEELSLALGLEENIRVYTGVEYAFVFNRMRNCYVTELSEDNTVSLYREFEGRETEIDSDEFLRGEN